MPLTVIAIACDWGAGQPGGAAGVQSWYQIALQYKHLAWLQAEHFYLAPPHHSQPWVSAGKHVYAHRLEAWETFAQQVETQLRPLPLNTATLFLTGDHSWSGILLQLLAEKVQSLGVIWLDAHADLHTPATSPSGNLHGMPLAMATGLNTHRIHPLPEATWQSWQQWVRSALPPENLLLFGLRSYEDPELSLIQTHRIPHFTAAEIHAKGVDPALAAARELAQRCEALYVSFDVDVWDPSIARGTGTPAVGGLSIAQVRSFLEEVFQWPQTRYVEVTEINPLLDCANSTALYAYGTVRPFVDKAGEDSGVV